MFSSFERESPIYRTFILLSYGRKQESRLQKGAEGMKDYDIVWVRGHVEVYDWAGRFCFSADNEREALEELELEGVA